jgi:RNA polymerase sigma factor (sigma-70 family)
MNQDMLTHRTTLEQEAVSLRRWLAGYFRRRVRNEADIDDMVQDVFARLAARDSTEPVEHLGGYVLKVAFSVLTDRARRNASHMVASHVALDVELHGGVDIDPERVLCGKEDLNCATAALLSLPERTRTVFILRRLEDYPYRKIAQHLGISVSAVEKHMARAIQHLSAEMEKRNGA